MCAPSDSRPECSRPPPGTATRRSLTGRLCARARPRLGRTDRGEGRPESSAVTTATCGHRPLVSAPAGCSGTAVLQIVPSTQGLLGRLLRRALNAEQAAGIFCGMELLNESIVEDIRLLLAHPTHNSYCTCCVAAAVADEGVLGAISAWWQRCAWVATGPKGARWDP
jgi:hypothetical protein